MATERLYFSSDDNLNIEKNAYDNENIERHQSRYYFAATHLSHQMNILDCACGSGYGSDILKDYCATVTGVDIDSEAVEFAKLKYRSEQIKYLCGDIRQLADSLHKMDAVVCLETLEHVSDPRILFDGFMKVLKEDGKLIVSTPVRERSRENPLNSFHCLEYTHNDLKRVLNHYFYEVDIYLQDQSKFSRIDDDIHWGFVVAVCQYPKNRTIENIDKMIIDKEINEVKNDNAKSYISKKASVAENVIFKPSFENGIYHIADGVEIRENTVIETHNQGHLIIGEGSVIGYNCWINATGDVEIGANTLVGANTIITSSSHHFKDNIPVASQGLSFKKVTIGDNVWIGSNVSILEGVCIGNNCVIGANCVVKNNLEPNSVLKANSELTIEKIKKNKVAFYLLPFSIRESALTFQCIYDRYKILAKSFVDKNWDVVFVSTNELGNIIALDGWNTVTPSNYDIYYDDNEWFSRWKKILNNENDSQHEEFLDSMISEINPEIIFCWNYDGLLKKHCQEQQISVYFNELGLSRKPNPVVYYSDPEGVNSTSSLQHFWKSFENFQLSDEELTIARITYGKVFNNYKINKERKIQIIDDLNLNSQKKIVLIVLQVEDDSNIIAGSSFNSMQQFVDLCQQCKNNDIQYIIKKHPAEPQCEIVVEDIPIIIEEYSSQELVALADYVYTVNSSLGFEALIAGKKVITFGNAPYTFPGIVGYFDFDTNKIVQAQTQLQPQENDFLKLIYLTYHQYFFSETKFFDAEFHIRRHLFKKTTKSTNYNYYFDNGSFFKDREIQVNHFQNKVLQKAILGYEEWIKSLKKTEENAAEISVWATSLNSHKKELEAKIITLQEQLKKSNEQIISLEKIIEDQKRNLFFRIADKLIKKSIKK
ncbi:methyltransferase domain-containing protein [Atlantibacter sp.]|uniref:capsular polysaccharide export protein, LipB/KpsS family n=1 Tax=Atlantibacter sp. TaxID=1903473 RepID=UPI0028A86EB0|nr:methyltransferase domain-containing protein [Atlantibacter sp.]